MSNDITFNSDAIDLELLLNILTKNIQENLLTSERDIANIINYYIPDMVSCNVMKTNIPNYWDIEFSSKNSCSHVFRYGFDLFVGNNNVK